MVQRYEEMVVCAAVLVLAGALLFGSEDLARGLRLPDWIVTRRRWFGALFACAAAAIVATSFLK